MDNDKENKETDDLEDKKISKFGQAVMNKNPNGYVIFLLTIIGEIEGHEVLPGSTKTTKYEHLLPQLARIEDNAEIDGVLIILNTVGGDVSCGLALAEMIAGLSKPTVSLVIGDSHSIGVPLAVATDYSYIVPSGTMLIHPVRMNGMIIGAKQTFNFLKRIQDRITGFISSNSAAKKERIDEMMMNTEEMTKDLGTLLIGRDAVDEGLINEVGGVKDATQKLYELIEKSRQKDDRM